MLAKGKCRQCRKRYHCLERSRGDPCRDFEDENSEAKQTDIGADRRSKERERDARC